MPPMCIIYYYHTHNSEKKQTVFIRGVYAALKPFSDKCKEAGACIDYLKTNESRLDFPHFRAMGLTTSSGIVESGCKHAIGARVKQSGMHWSAHGANAIIALRCATLNNRFDAFMIQRKGV
ncbi:MAG: hypothetical protein K9L21_02605 [Spirochaetia bacterium]|nr:hypothetical protein [Spirochaetia bacterium]